MQHPPPPRHFYNPRWKSTQNNEQWQHFQPRGPFQYRGRPNFNRPTEMHNSNQEYWCETCDRGFKNKELLESHKAQHQKCNIDGCQFVAHPKVITKHIQMQHSTGLYKKIATSNNPEDIKKWIEERKRRFPTKKNIELKAAEMKEKMERGEKMGLARARGVRKRDEGVNKKKNHFDSGAIKNLPKHMPPNSNFNKKSQPKIKSQKELPKLEVCSKLKPFSGIQSIIVESGSEDVIDVNCQFSIEDESEDDSENKHEIPELKPSVCGALSSLICNYESSEEEISDKTEVLIEPNDICFKNTNKTNVHILEQIEKNHIEDDHCGPTEAKITKHEIHTDISNNAKVVRRGKDFKNSKQIRPQFTRKRNKLPSTLLEKLLSREIQHERNIVLQCVRHIVKENFFDEKVVK